MAVIKNNYFFPIYCPDANPVNGEKNFSATGQDIVDTVGESDLYVKKTGDEMTGSLTFTKDDGRPHFTLLPKGSGTEDFTTDIVNHRGNLRFRTVPGDSNYDGFLTHMMISRPVGGHTINNVDVVGKTQINYVATPSEDHHAANRFYVDDRDRLTKEELEDEIDDLKQKIIELEEEIDAIGSAVVRGYWNVNTTDTVPAAGEYVLLNGSSANTTNFSEAEKVLYSQHDSEGNPHTFADAEVEDFLQILNEDNVAYGLYTVKVISGPISSTEDYYQFEVSFDQGYNAEGESEPTAVGLGRLKLFTPPVMDVEDYLLKSGGTITGVLNIGQDTNTNGRLVVYGSGGDATNNPGGKLFDVNPTSNSKGGNVNYYGRITEDTHIITKGYYLANLDKAPPGDAATIEVGTTTTVAPDQPASVTNSGDENAAVFDFDIPQGIQGEQGEKGDKGTEVIIANSNTPPADQPKGSLVLTQNNRFYIYY